jgi:PAS domain S-box-containing protein
LKTLVNSVLRVSAVAAGGVAAARSRVIPRSSIRAYVCLMALAMTVPLCTLTGIALHRMTAADQANSDRAVRQLARITATETDLLLAEMRNVLDQLSRKPSIRNADASRCDAIFGDLNGNELRWVSLTLTDNDGRGTCTSSAPPIPVYRLEREHEWVRVSAEADPAVPPGASGQPEPVWTVALAVPVFADNGVRNGMLTAAFDLGRFHTESLRGKDFANGSTIELVDANGTVMARSPRSGQPHGLVPVVAPAAPLEPEFLRRAKLEHQGVLHTSASDGGDRIVGYASLASLPWLAVVTTPADPASTGDAASRNGWTLLAVAALALAGAAFGTRQMLLRPAPAIGPVDAPKPEAPAAVENSERDDTSFRQLFELASDAVLIIDPSDRILFANPAVERIFGYAPDALIGSEITILQPPRLREAHRIGVERFRTAGRGGQAGPAIETTGLHADGRELPIEIACGEIAFGGGVAYAGFIRDISLRKRAESELRQLNATLEQKVRERTVSLEAANRELEAFSYSVSHDLRAPLRAISGFTELVADGYAERLDDEARGYLARVKAASTRMSNLINDLLDLSRVSRAEILRGSVDLSRLADEVVAELRAGDPERNVNVTIEPGMSAQADPGLARILLANLIGNAWKFTVKRAQATIEVGLTGRNGRAVFFVRDNGSGFDMAHADKLFAPFQRLHTEREFTGTGIGLAIVQRIVHRHGGSVTAESAEDVGTTLYFSFDPDNPT